MEGPATVELHPAGSAPAVIDREWRNIRRTLIADFAPVHYDFRRATPARKELRHWPWTGPMPALPSREAGIGDAQ